MTVPARQGIEVDLAVRQEAICVEVCPAGHGQVEPVTTRWHRESTGCSR